MASGVDGSVRRVETPYAGQGNLYLITSYDATTGGSVVNQIQRAYNGLGQMTQEWQATSGAVNTSTTPSVQYGYSFAPSGSTNHSRLTSITYPNGRVLTYNYATGLADNISRLSSITDGATTLENYDYLGLGTVVRRGHTQTGVDQTYVKLTGESDGAAGDKYIGLDSFGRVIDQRWTTSGGTTADRFGYAYDRDSNRLYKENLVSSSNSELYSYDNLNQLSSFQRGTLNGTKTGLTGSATRSQSWDFDALGNFDSQTTDGTTQTRSANKQNEITSISGATTPTYDSNGNLTKDETGRTFTYDAWNRLATVKDSGGTLLATYKWDGLGHRVREIRGSTTTDLYYSNQWQVLEERVGGVAKFSYAWSPVYVDAMIARDRDTDANGTLDERLYAVQDANFNATALINTSGTVVERYQYDPFGKFGAMDGSWVARGSSSYGWNYLHQGGRWDADGGIYSFRNRELSPTLGRWLQMDPIGFGGRDSNLFRYESNSGLLDPSGLAAARLFQFALTSIFRASMPAIGPSAMAMAGAASSVTVGAVGSIVSSAGEILPVSIAVGAGVIIGSELSKLPPFQRIGGQIGEKIGRWLYPFEEISKLPYPRVPPIDFNPRRRREDKSKSCFAAGTPIRTRLGSIDIEHIKVGDFVLSRDENNPQGVLVEKIVEEKFENTAEIWELIISGKVIESAAEHPFYIRDKGWVACNQIIAGDSVLCENGEFVVVDRLSKTNRWEKVFNFTVADYHTYFVGKTSWGFSVWSHNACVSVYKHDNFAERKHFSVEVTDDDGNRVHTHQSGRQGTLAKAEYFDEYSMLPDLGNPWRTKISNSVAKMAIAALNTQVQNGNSGLEYNVIYRSCTVYVYDVLRAVNVNPLPDRPVEGDVSRPNILRAGYLYKFLDEKTN